MDLPNDIGGIVETTSPTNEDVFIEPISTVTDRMIDILVTNSVSIETYYPQMGPKRDPLYVVIPITIVYLLIFLTGIIGNVSTCIVIGRNKTMHTATNYYLFSLAVSDLLLLVTGLPQEVYYLWSRYPYVFGEAFCIGRGLAAETSANATVLTITAFTIERYVAICRPFLSHTMSKLSRAVKLILLVWFLSLLVAIPQALQFGVVAVHPKHKELVLCSVKHIIIKHSFELHTLFLFILPMTLITILYILIGLRLRHSNMMKKESSASTMSATSNAIGGAANVTLMTRSNSKPFCRSHQGQSSRRVLKMLVAVVVAFFLCWAPFHAQRLVAIYGTLPSPHNSQSKSPMLRLYEVVTYVSGVLYYLSTTINPMLYHLMSNKFRSAFKDTFSRWCCYCLPRETRRRMMLGRSYSALSQQRMAAAGLAINENASIGQSSCVINQTPGGDAGEYKRNSRSFNNGRSTGQGGSGRGFRRITVSGRNSDSNNIIQSDHSTDCSGNSTCTLPRCNSYSNQQPCLLSTHPSGRPSTTSLSESTQLTILSRDSSKKESIHLKSSSKKNKNTKRDDIFGSNIVTPPSSRTRKLWRVFRSIARRHIDDDRTYYSPPASHPTLPTTNGAISSSQELKSQESVSSLTPCNISNSSLRDVERGALEDELTIYMQELQRREQENFYLHR